jgi:hypothetical protein
MRLVDSPLPRRELEPMAERMFGGLVKGVVDISKRIMVLDADLHADQERYLIEQGSRQEDLWGINLYPAKSGEDFIEFDSMINISPSRNNLSRSVEDPTIRETITKIVRDLTE